MCLAQLIDLLFDIYVNASIPSFSSLHYFLAWGMREKIDSMKFLCLTVIPFDETTRVLLLFTHSGSSFE